MGMSFGRNRVTMADIGKVAGVSASTVSRALAGSPNIPEITRQHVLKIAAELNYRVDERARNFRLQRSQTIATLFPYQGESKRQISDPFYMEIAGAITDELDLHGYDLIIARVSVGKDDWCARYIADKRVDGVILIDRALDDAGVNTLQAMGANFVIWGQAVPDQQYASVGVDNVAGAAEAVRHLAALGRRNIGFIGGFGGMIETDSRRQGYLLGMEQAGLAADSRLMCFTDFTPDAAQRTVQSLLQAAPQLDGLLVCSDFMAVAVMETLRGLGRSVPDTISVIGFDDIPLAAYCTPRLSTVHQPIQEGGRHMARKLLAMLDGEPPTPETLPYQLIVRDSCGGR
jgi:DNA-binding LacI/PurR family transcriptional regulator